MGYLLWGLIYTLGLLPIDLRRALGHLLGLVIARFPTRERTIASLQLRQFFNPAQSATVVNRMYASLGQSAFETFNLNPLLDAINSSANNAEHKTFIDCPELAKIQEIYSRGRGIVALTAHTGNWDLMGAYFAKCGIRVATIGREARVVALQDLLVRIREKYGIQTIWRQDPQAMKQLLSRLNRGWVIAALIDQDTYVHSRHVPFFGRYASTPDSLVKVAKRRNIPIVSTFIFRLESGKYRIFLRELNGDESVEDILTQYHTQLENHLRHYPEQWVWFHKRWRTLPSGERLATADYIKFLRRGMAA